MFGAAQQHACRLCERVHVRRVCAFFTARVNRYLTICYISSYPLFAFTPIMSGGLGLSEAMIGIHMAIRAITNVFITMFYPSVERQFGTVRTYQLSMWLWPVTVLGFPLLNAAARSVWIQQNSWVMWFSLLIFWSVWSVACFAWCAWL